MPGIIVEIDTSDLERSLERTVSSRSLMDRIGVTVASRFQQRFTGNPPWEDRAIPNVGGIVRYLQKGQVTPEIPNRFFQSRPALVDTGRLRASITHEVVDDHTVAVGTNAEYARKQQLGLPSTLPGAGKHGDANVRRGLASWLKRHPEDKESLAWLFGRDEITITPRARDFLLVTPEIEAEVRDVIDDWIDEQIDAEGA